MGAIGCPKTSVQNYRYSQRNNAEDGTARLSPKRRQEVTSTRCVITLRMEPLGCPETSVRSYRYSLRNNPVERSSQLLRFGSKKSPQSNIHVHTQCLISGALSSPTGREEHPHLEVVSWHR
jgi:hypothetical protein